MSFSPPRERQMTNDFFSEIGDVLDKKSSSYLASWDPQSLLNPQQKDAIETVRNSASRNIVLANKALTGILNYDEWVSSSKALQEKINHSKPMYIQLKKPPNLSHKSLFEYVQVILGLQLIEPYNASPLVITESNINMYSKYLPPNVTIEALGETLLPSNSRSLITNAIVELEEIYNELRIAIEPKAGDAISINVSHDNMFEVSQLVVRNALNKLETAFNGPFLRAIGEYFVFALIILVN